jgi:spermidine synthase
LGLPFLAFCLRLRRQYSARIARLLPAVLGLVLLWSLFGAQDFESRLRNHHQTEVRRDYAATVISYEDQTRYLLVNGIGMTTLSSITKFMAHLPLAFHQDPPRSALVICFGMGTSYRSAMSWNIDTTAVELVPGVTRAFGFYHADAARLMTATNGHIITDDGRRFLKRTARKFDVIIVDPPPPVNAAGSSLLYSKEFYDLAKEHLAPGGILQMWFPGNPDTDVCQAAIRSIYESFPNLRCFQSVQHWGIHMLASMSPIPALDADALAARMPPAAQRDLLEWAPVTNAPACLNAVLRREISVPRCLNPDLDVQVTDDEPYNEYFLLRILLPAQTGAPGNTP